jgi:predicted dehydrogenase
LKFAIWGCGSIGQRHLRNVLHLGHEDVVAFDTSQERRGAVGKQYGVPVLSSEEDLLDSGADITVIATPTILHGEQLRQVLTRTDSHVFVEKPVSHTLESLAEILEPATPHTSKVMVGCNWRFYPGIQRVKELLDQGAIGVPVSARVEGGSYLPSWHPREDYRLGYSARRDLGGGCLLDCIHEIDYSNWFFGRPVSVAGFHGSLGGLGIETEDVAALLIRYEAGAIVSVNVDYVQRPAHRSCRVVGREGTIEWDLASDRVRWYSVSEARWEEWQVPDQDALDASYVAEMEYFIDAVQTNSEHMSGLHEGAEALAVVEAAKTSQRSGQVVFL